MKTPVKTKSDRVSVKTRIRTADLRTVEFFCDAYDLPVAQLLQEQAYGQAETIVDCPFSVLERMDDNTGTKDTSEIVLEFCPEAHAILSRVAEILRRTLSELLQGLMGEAGFSLRYSLDEALKTPDGIHDQDLEGWANQAIAFERLAKRNRVHAKRDGWDTFTIDPPEARQTKLALSVA